MLQCCECPGVPFPLIPTGPLAIVASLFLVNDTSLYSKLVQFAEQIRFSDSLPCTYSRWIVSTSGECWRHMEAKCGTTASVESSGWCKCIAAGSHSQLCSQPKPASCKVWPVYPFGHTTVVCTVRSLHHFCTRFIAGALGKSA